MASTEGPTHTKLNEIYDLIHDLRQEQADECLVVAAYAALRGIDMRKPDFADRPDRKDRVRRARQAVFEACRVFPAPTWES